MTEKILKNPITKYIKVSVDSSMNKLNFAVPFISSFALSILHGKNTTNVKSKRLLTRFDDSNINTFDLPTLKTLLDFGFEIQFDNNIHLKLYITDNETFVSSSNLTKGGFVDNVELTVKVDSGNTKSCADLFDEIWVNSQGNKVTYDLIKSNWIKYEVLKKREKYSKQAKTRITTNQLVTGKLNIQQLINEIFIEKKDFLKISNIVFEANKIREQVKINLMQGFNTELFYVTAGHSNRRNNLFYYLNYSHEGEVAGTGLRELQFKTVFEHPNFEKVIAYIFPETIGMKPWNFQDSSILKEFCNGIFDFDIPQYSEALPIRLASYFYPEFFLPIFRLKDLKKVCIALGIETDAKTKGDKLFIYNSFISDKMKTLPCDNYIKAHISYEILFTVDLYNELNIGRNYDDILLGYEKSWEKGFIKDGRNFLVKLNIAK